MIFWYWSMSASAFCDVGAQGAHLVQVGLEEEVPVAPADGQERGHQDEHLVQRGQLLQLLDQGFSIHGAALSAPGP
jgi:hypothetical protein